MNLQPSLTVRSRLILLTGVVVLTTLLPYLVPGVRSASLAYLAHFNNKVCVLVFVVLGGLYAVLTRGELGKEDAPQTDRSLSPLHLALAVILFAVLLVLQLRGGPNAAVGLEILFHLNRLHMLVSGLTPYTQFDYPYGPLNIYLPYFFTHVIHMSPERGYNFAWFLLWMAGIGMVWYAVRNLAATMPWRVTLFWSYLAMCTLNMLSEGIAYTPVRIIGAAFATILGHKIVRRFGASWTAALLLLMIVLLAFAVSAEQGFGLAFGFVGWLLLLALRSSTQVSRSAILAFTLATCTLCAALFRTPYCRLLRQFSQGAFSFPLTFSLPLSLILVTYVAGGCLAYRIFKRADFSHQAVPQVLTGLVMLPAAFGRSDLGHVQFASSLLFLGFAAVQSHTELRRWWTYSFLVFFSIPAAFSMLSLVRSEAHYIRHKHTNTTDTATVAAPATGGPVLQEPCPVVYAVIDITPDPHHSAADSCMSPGYYDGFIDVYTDEAVTQKIDSLRSQGNRPLLLWNKPLDEQFPTIESELIYLRPVQQSLYLPIAKEEPFTFSRIRDYVRDNYTPEPEVTGPYRVWRPKHP